MKIITSIIITLFSLQPSLGLSDTEEKIWEELKSGGLVVLMRHTTTLKEKNPLLRDPSCIKERMLSEKGKKEAARIGKRFTTKGVLINKVLVSPYCRTTDTGKIAFTKVEVAEFLSLLEALSQNKAEANTKTLQEKIASYSGTGNLVLVTHAPNINAVSFESVEMGAFLVLKPMGDNEFEELGKINLAIK
ncbi:MAG: histidine phosphatase family protein [Gammaproteobacteria bacterium]|nr:histidine phosphatase family protein [Gammaproteobacteria bacterium]